MVQIGSLEIRQEEQELLVSAQISMPEQTGTAWFRLPVDSKTDVEAAADAFFAIGLILAIGSDGVLEMDTPVSRRLAYNARAIQDILLGWYPKRVTRARLNIELRDRDRPALTDRTVSCFTGGVDSFDTLIVNEADVDALLYVHGFDIPLHRTAIREATSRHLNEIAEMTGKELIEISTNIRVFLNQAGTWPALTHGAALAAVGHLLSGRFGRLLLPASHQYSDTFAWGSHPLLDHLWSSDRLSVIHDGAGSTRVAKTRRLAYYPAAQRHLRVCWQNTGKYNCGECDKCMRTMVALSLTGVLPQFQTFESEIPLDKLRALKITGVNGLSFVLENLDYAKAQNNASIAAILAAMVDDFHSRKKKSINVVEVDKNAARSVASQASMEKTITALESRVSTVERRIANSERQVDATQRSVRRLQSLWPLRTWARIRRHPAGVHTSKAEGPST